MGKGFELTPDLVGRPGNIDTRDLTGANAAARLEKQRFATIAQEKSQLPLNVDDLNKLVDKRMATVNKLLDKLAVSFEAIASMDSKQPPSYIFQLDNGKEIRIEAKKTAGLPLEYQVYVGAKDILDTNNNKFSIDEMFPESPVKNKRWAAISQLFGVTQEVREDFRTKKSQENSNILNMSTQINPNTAREDLSNAAD